MVPTLKRLLRPLRPILGPIWRWMRRSVDRERRTSLPNRLQRTTIAVRAKVDRLLRRSRIRALTHVEILDLAAEVPYYKARRVYLGASAAVASELIARKHLRSALELGPHLRSLIVGADTMDIAVNPDLQSEGRRFIHDATQAPWPIEDRAYDLFVALQVFEHLLGHQAEAFLEVRRIAANAILSLPIDWEMSDPRNGHHMISVERVLGWFAPVAPTRIEIGNPGHRKRLLFIFEDLPPPGPEDVRS